MQADQNSQKIVLRTMDINHPESCVKLDYFDTVAELATHLEFNSRPEDGFYSIRGADLTGLKLKQGLRLTLLHLEDVILKDAELEQVMFNRIRFKNVDFSGAQMQGGMIIGGKLKGCIFNDADMHGCSLMSLKIRGGSFTGAKMPSSTLESSKFHGVDFQRAYMNGSDFRRTTWDGCDLRGAQTENIADFNEFTVLNTRFDEGFARQMKGGLGRYNPRVSPQRMRGIHRKPRI